MSPQDESLIGVQVGLAIFSLLVGLLIRRRERMPIFWQQSLGKIVASRTERHRVGNNPAGPPKYEVIPVIEYEFIYNGKAFRSTHWRFANFSLGSSTSAESITSHYPVGSAVTVHVNPRNPQKSVLETGSSCLCWIPFAFSILLVLTSCATFVSQLIRK